MGVIQKQSISGVFWSYVGIGLGFITTAILFTRFLDAEEIGLLRLLVSYSSILAMFAGLGISTVIIKVFPQFRDENNGHHGFLGFVLLVTLAGFLITSLVFVLFKNLFAAKAGDDPSLFMTYFYTVIPLTLFTVLFSVLDSYFRVLFDAVKGTLFKEVYQRFIIIAAIALYYFKVFDFGAFVWIYVLANVIPVLFFVILLIRQKKLHLKINFSFFNKEFAKEIISVGVFGILASFSGILVQSIDVIMIDHFLGLSSAGVYTISFFFGTLILVPMRTMAKIGSVIISEAWKKNDLKTIADVYTKSSLTLSIVGLLFFVGIWGNIDNVFHLIGDQYSEGKYVILFIALANVVEVSVGLAPHIIINSKYFKWQTYLLIMFAVILVITNIIFIPIFGITGAALATLISKLAYSMMKFVFIKLRFKIQPFNFKHLVLVIIAIAAWLASTIIPELSNYILDTLLRCVAITFLMIIPVYYVRISDDVNLKINELLATVKNMLRP
jgi:O-antigen/teichoic acid export membrane protein